MQAGRIAPTTDTITLDGTLVTYTVRRNPRAKYMRITISPYHGVVVTLPARLKRYVNPAALLREKKEWVLEQLQRIPVSSAPKPLENGSVVYYLGKEYRVRLRSGELWTGCELAHGVLSVHMPHDFEGDPKEIVLAWIKAQAAKRIKAEAEHLAEVVDVHYTRVSVRDQKTKWGSCSKAGALSFNWRLILFPPKVLRYIVVHELCHLRHFNHSQRFWNLVARHDPDYESSIEWLKTNGLRMEAALR
ncbi:MAG TPA: SprT family zinc-dependent metalloprotease [Candidatus Kapabacteria bacterium]|nr:SprT family zinc-dependent metalloprotease [Candidatus Kapabacteria bacterium]